MRPFNPPPHCLRCQPGGTASSAAIARIRRIRSKPLHYLGIAGDCFVGLRLPQLRRSFHPGFRPLMRASLRARDPAFSCFSRMMASLM